MYLTRQEQKNLVTEIAAQLAKSICKQIDDNQVPETWDGIELRWLVEEKARSYSQAPSQNRRRHRDYKNDVLVRNL